MRELSEFRERKQPETLRFRSVMPTMTVEDIQASIAWYRDVLGFVIEDTIEHEGKTVGASVLAGDVRFLLGQDDWAKGRDRNKGEGFRLYCVTAQDIDQLAAEIKARGCELLQEPTDQPWGTRDFALADPDGFKISISTASA
jgi:uncharacterized glyoxalase superfamily protein PhnB